MRLMLIMMKIAYNLHKFSVHLPTKPKNFYLMNCQGISNVFYPRSPKCSNNSNAIFNDDFKHEMLYILSHSPVRIKY